MREELKYLPVRNPIVEETEVVLPEVTDNLGGGLVVEIVFKTRTSIYFAAGEAADRDDHDCGDGLSRGNFQIE